MARYYACFTDADRETDTQDAQQVARPVLWPHVLFRAGNVDLDRKFVL